MVQIRKLIYRLDEGNAAMRDLLGSKGAGLCEMAKLGLPVPPGFVITTEACLEYYARGNRLPNGLWEDIQEHLHWLEKTMGRQFGSNKNPLLVSVRSGAAVSMPGMMDTILNLGINNEVVVGLAALMHDERAAFDAYRRFLQVYGRVVMNLKAFRDDEYDRFEEILACHKKEAGVRLDHELNPESLRRIVAEFKATIKAATGRDVPFDPWEQLREAVQAVFRSWNNPRAIQYRNFHGISHDLGTAVTIMAMVFGNLNDRSGTGVLFTRNPANGQKEIYGEYLPNAQGEDVVAGIRTPQSIASLAHTFPEVYKQLDQAARQLERHYSDVQDVEFTVEDSRLYMLQTRSAKRTALASVKTAVDMVEEGLISIEEALMRVDPEELMQLFAPRFDARARASLPKDAFLARGFGASPGAATGKVIFEASRAAETAKKGISVILVRPVTDPNDIQGIQTAAGVLTSRGGITSHAAVVTRGLGKPCIVGCEELQVNLAGRYFTANGHTIKEGDAISIDGTTGEVFAGAIPTTQPRLEELEEAQKLLSWADKVRRLGVWANADTPADAQRALSMGAEGIGLCRTEHMFLGPGREEAVKELLLNAREAEHWEQEHSFQEDVDTDNDRWKDAPSGVREFYQALAYLEQLQTEDFMGILRVMGGRPVIIRLLDAKLHEYLPEYHYEELLKKVIELRLKGAPEEEIRPIEESLQLVASIREANPMLGHRGCRFGITSPAIYKMQMKAIITASCHLMKEGIQVHPEIMIPLTAHVNELRQLQDILGAVAENVQKEMGAGVHFKFGTMIEIPRAALTAGEIAKVAEFFSFGTNDLTQTTYGFSRDDAEGKFLRFYLDRGILPANPFNTIDTEGVGALIRIAVDSGRSTRPDLEVGICGEHGGDPASIAFCHQVGLNYVSCSPFRVPVARLAAARAALKAST